MSFYTDTIRHWATDTRRAGILPNADGTGEVGLEAGQAGRQLAVRFTLAIEQDLVTDVRYQVFGCGFTIAACAVAADLAVGYSLDTAAGIDARKIDKVLEGLPSDRGYCADLAAEALQAAISSVHKNKEVVEAGVDLEDHGPRVNSKNPAYKMLTSSPGPGDVAEEDRHLFACLLSIAVAEPWGTAAALGLADDDIDWLLKNFFPGADHTALKHSDDSARAHPPKLNREVLNILRHHIPANHIGRRLHVSAILTRILATRAVLPGHLWVAMGLFERPELSAAIRRHLPSLAAANHQNMRWKRFLYKQVCDQNGGTLCKAPNCGVCSDYALCFAEEA